MEHNKFRNTLAHRLSAGLVTLLAMILVAVVMQYQGLFSGVKGFYAAILISSFVVITMLRVFDLFRLNKNPLIFMGAYNIVFMIAQIVVFAPLHILSLIWIVLLVRTRSYLDAFWSYVWLAVFALSSLAGLVVAEGNMNDFYSVVAEIGIVLLVALVLQDSESQKAGFYRAQVDETVASKRLQHRLESMFNNISLAIFGLDKTGAVVVYNHAALNIINKNAELHGININSVLAISDEEGKHISFAELNKTISKTERDDVYLHIGHDERTPINLIVSRFHESYAVNDGISLVLTMQDITKQKKLNTQQEDFISVVSHELRTPITVAEGGVSNALLVNKKNGDNEVIGRALNVAHEQVEFLSQIVNNVNTLTQSAKDKLEVNLERIFPKEIVMHTAKIYENSVNKDKLRLVCKVDDDVGSIISSREFIEDIMKNLVENALKYTEEGEITIGAYKDQKLINFYVKDTGIGISHSDISNIFDKFFRVESHEIQQKGGTGLGLYVSTQLAERINSELSVDSRPGEGSIFTLSVPRVGALARDTNQVSRTEVSDFMSGI